jgi:hypothetical protein
MALLTNIDFGLLPYKNTKKAFLNKKYGAY